MQVLSASRRTDIPAFYMDWFMTGLDDGFFVVSNPFNGKTTHVPADPEHVAAIVFWSKNYRAFLDGNHLEELLRRGYRLFFHFTVNSEDPLLEPSLPSLEDRLGQAEQLAAVTSPGAVVWRFDPICFYELPEGRLEHNLTDFPRIAERMGRIGIRTCITSFLDLYPKVKRRALRGEGIRFVDPPAEKRRRLLWWMRRELLRRGIRLQVCCSPVGSRKGKGKDAVSGSGGCISHSVLEALYGPMGLTRRRDRGQRTSQGCACHESKDVGSYREHPCFHGCLYCYGNPVRRKGGKP